jgi:hypothetical protein
MLIKQKEHGASYKVRQENTFNGTDVFYSYKQQKIKDQGTVNNIFNLFLKITESLNLHQVGEMLFHLLKIHFL